ncbi:MAG: class I SAM-dependent methyltransferase [Methanoregula sp.]
MKNVWEDIHSARDWGRYPNEELVRFIGRNFFRIPRSERHLIKILELGCGQGANLWFIAREGFDAQGIDISPTAVQKCKKNLEEWNIPEVTLTVGDITDMSMSEASIDAVIDVATMFCIPYSIHKKIYSEIFKILKPGGKFWSFHLAEGSWGSDSGQIIEYKTFGNLTEGPAQNQGSICMPSDSDLRQLLEEAGFRVNTIEKHIRTYENQTHNLIHWIIEAEKP